MLNFLNFQPNDMKKLIQLLNEVKSKKEEEQVLSNEIEQLIKLNISPNSNNNIKREFILKSILLDTLGYNVSNLLVKVINLCADENISIKRLAYIALSNLIHGNYSIFILTISTIQKDLESSKDNEVMCSLIILNQISNVEILNGIQATIFKLSQHKNYHIRKKVLCLLYKIYQIIPSLQREIDQVMKINFELQNIDLIQPLLNYYYIAAQSFPSNYKNLIPSFVQLYEKIINNRFNDYVYHKLPNPWALFQLLKIFRILCQYDENNSNYVYPILEISLIKCQTLENNILCAFCFEIIQTVVNIYPNFDLFEKILPFISKFISSSNPCLKYVGMHGLSNLLKMKPSYFCNFQKIIINCFDHEDIELKIQASVILINIINPQNYSIIIDTLLSFIKKNSFEENYKNELIIKLHSIISKYAEKCEWFLVKTLELFELSDKRTLHELKSRFFEILEEWENLEDKKIQIKYAINIFLEKLQSLSFSFSFSKQNQSESVIEIMCCTIGNYSCDFYSFDEIETIIKSLCHLFSNSEIGQDIQTILIYNIMKLHSFIQFKKIEDIITILEDNKNSSNIILQQRINQYINILKNCSNDVLPIYNLFKKPENPDYNFPLIEVFLKNENKEYRDYDPKKCLITQKFECKPLNFSEHNSPKTNKSKSNLKSTLNLSEELIKISPSEKYFTKELIKDSSNNKKEESLEKSKNKDEEFVEKAKENSEIILDQNKNKNSSNLLEIVSDVMTDHNSLDKVKFKNILIDSLNNDHTLNNFSNFSKINNTLDNMDPSLLLKSNSRQLGIKNYENKEELNLVNISTSKFEKLWNIYKSEARMIKTCKSYTFQEELKLLTNYFKTKIVESDSNEAILALDFDNLDIQLIHIIKENNTITITLKSESSIKIESLKEKFNKFYD